MGKETCVLNTLNFLTNTTSSLIFHLLPAVDFIYWLRDNKLFGRVLKINVDGFQHEMKRWVFPVNDFKGIKTTFDFMF